MSSSLKGLTVLASFAVQPVTRETESERYFENHYIAHKDILQKLIHDLSGQNAFAEIVDRNIKTPSLINIYVSNVWLRKSKLTPEQFKKMVREENLILKNYKNKKCRQ